MIQEKKFCLCPLLLCISALSAFDFSELIITGTGNNELDLRITVNTERDGKTVS
jgi:hypothetical protein